MISCPMDYGSIQTKLEAGGYPDADAFASDVRLARRDQLPSRLLLPTPTPYSYSLPLLLLLLLLLTLALTLALP